MKEKVRVKGYRFRLEGYIQLHVRTRPAWIPHFFWQWLLNKVLIMEYWKEESSGIWSVGLIKNGHIPSWGKMLTNVPNNWK